MKHYVQFNDRQTNTKNICTKFHGKILKMSFLKNEKHTPKWAQKYPKMALNKDKNYVKTIVVTITVSTDASLNMTRLRI